MKVDEEEREVQGGVEEEEGVSSLVSRWEDKLREALKKVRFSYGNLPKDTL